VSRGFLDEDRAAGEAVQRAHLVDILAEVRRETDKAWLIFDGAREAWLPKSKVERDGSTFTLPEWLAREKGLLGDAEATPGGRLI
jgi:hypothetical protein